MLAFVGGGDLRELEQLDAELGPFSRLRVERRLQLFELQREREDLRVLLGGLRRDGEPRQPAASAPPAKSVPPARTARVRNPSREAEASTCE